MICLPQIHFNKYEMLGLLKVIEGNRIHALPGRSTQLGQDTCAAVSEAVWKATLYPRDGTEIGRCHRWQRAYGMDPVRAGIRYPGVTLSWFTWFK